ncbi:HPr family phosphocarrier protein [Brachyspira alvinipulli]|uniref:HPr family phosphocarrier protein n=1 Tax=Brachyspira alvinipulli TaxID=84379 RepID=UPI0004B92F4A|nr:HPr family phosphocarrier protein [Brachyspira alvinipulli]
MIDNDFLSKEFIYKKNPSVINSIVDFIKNNIEDKIEIGDSTSDKRANAKSLLKVMALLSKNNGNITIYCYGDKKEYNLNIIENFLYENEFCSLDEEIIKHKKIYDYDKELEKEILSLTPNTKKENIQNKITLLKRKRETKHTEYTDSKNILYIKNNNKTEIFNFIDSDILQMIKNIALFYEITIDNNYVENIKNYIINTLKLEDIKYFYKDIFFNSIQKYFINNFDKAYIKKIMDEEYIKDTEYDVECINKIIKDSIKTFEYILKNKREISFNIPDIYLKNLNYSNIKSNIISIVTNLFIIYEIEYKLINEDLISFASKITQFIGENLLSGMGSSSNILIENIVNYFQKQFEYAYISSIIGEDSSVIEYDFNYIKRFI